MSKGPHNIDSSETLLVGQIVLETTSGDTCIFFKISNDRMQSSALNLDNAYPPLCPGKGLKDLKTISDRHYQELHHVDVAD